jgi:hypothetical protein
MEQMPVYDRIDWSLWPGWSGQNNANPDGPRRAKIGGYFCPSDPGTGRVPWTDPS